MPSQVNTARRAECLEKAREAEDQAQIAADAAAKEVWLRIAQSYYDLAGLICARRVTLESAFRDFCEAPHFFDEQTWLGAPDDRQYCWAEKSWITNIASDGSFLAALGVRRSVGSTIALLKDQQVNHVRTWRASG